MPVPTPRKKRAPGSPKPKPNRGVNKGKRGQPPRYRAEFADTAKLLCEKGLTDQEIAEVFGIAVSTYYVWQTKHPKFGDAITLGKRPADLRVDRSMYQSAIGGFTTRDEKIIYDADGNLIRREVSVKEHPPSESMQKWWSSNRDPERWRQKQEFEVKTAIADLEDHQLTERISQLIAKAKDDPEFRAIAEGG